MGKLEYTPSTASYRTIVFVLEWSSTRIASGVSVTYSFYAFRENAWSDTQTQGNISWHVCINDSDINSGSQSVLIPNDHSRVYFANNVTYTVPVSDQYSGGSFSISMYSTSSNNPNLVCAKQSATENYSAFSERTAPGTPTINILDNGNNSFTLKISKGSNGNGNPATGYYAQYDTGPGWARCYDEHHQEISSDCTVNLKAYTTGTYSNSDEVSTSKTILYYGNPSYPGKPILSSKHEGKPTLKEDLTFRWTAANAGSSHAPIRGYRIRLKVNRSFYDLDPNSANDYIDTGNTNTYWTIPQSIKDTLKIKDTIQLSIYAYSTNGAGTPIFNGGGTAEAQVLSDVYTISSNGVVRVNVPGLGYKSGVVYVKDTSGNWKEAQGVFANSSGSWKESQ